MATDDTDRTEDVVMIPINQIRVLNPRARDPKGFKEIVASIRDVGLKRPITLTLRNDGIGDGAVYDLVCGQGRLEAFIELGEAEIPALVKTASREDRLVMSLVENLARRAPASFDHVVQIARLRDQGYTATDIGKKVGRHGAYVGGILRLWDTGEERLIRAVEQGRIPLSVAIDLTHATDADEQRIRSEAYQTGQLVGNPLKTAMRILQERRDHGKKMTPGSARHRPAATAAALVKSIAEQAARQRGFVKKAQRCENLLRVAIAALKTVLANEHFVTLLRAEGLLSLPRLIGTEAPWSVDPRCQQETA